VSGCVWVCGLSCFVDGAAQLNEDEDRYLGYIMSILNNQHMFFSHDYDLTHSVQRIADICADPLRRQARPNPICIYLPSTPDSITRSPLPSLMHVRRFISVCSCRCGRALMSVSSTTGPSLCLPFSCSTRLSFVYLCPTLPHPAPASFLSQPLIERQLHDWILPIVSGYVVMAPFSAKVLSSPSTYPHTCCRGLGHGARESAHTGMTFPASVRAKPSTFC
jgi:hypothetical protein